LIRHLSVLGKLLHNLGHFNESVEALKRSVEISIQINSQKTFTRSFLTLKKVLWQQGKLEEAIKTLEHILAMQEQLENQQQQVMTLNLLGVVLQEKGDINKAIYAFERSLELSLKIGDKQLQETTQRTLGEVLHRQGCMLLTQKESWNEAEGVLRRSQYIFEELDDFRNLVMVLNSLGSLLRKQGKWDAAETTLRYCYNLSEKLEDPRGQAIIFNSLGQVLSRQQDAEKFELALMYFRASIKLGKELDDQTHLAQVYTAMGQALLRNGETEQAVIQLIQGFEIDEKSRNSSGLALVTPHLTSALRKLGRQDEALAYCQCALAIAPKNRKLQELYDRLFSPNPLKQGAVKHIRYNTQQRCYWGHITPTDRTADIYFREGFIDSDSIAQLKPGTLVEVEIQQTSKGLCAKSIRIVEDFYPSIG
jgi:tetratricopeptide (TPR) repeat protein